MSQKYTLTASGVSSPKDSALGTVFTFLDQGSIGHYYMGWILLLRNWFSEHSKCRAALPLNEKKKVKLWQFEVKQMNWFQGTFEHIRCLESKCSTYIQISPLKLNEAQVQVIYWPGA